MTETKELTPIERYRQYVKESQSSVYRKIEVFLKSQKVLNDAYEKFFNEFEKKYPGLVILEKEKVSEPYYVRVFPMNPETGNQDFYKSMIDIDVIRAEYTRNNFEINRNLLPNDFGRLDIYVEEHIKYTRRGYTHSNEGWKVRARINYDDTNLYKTVGKIVEKIKDRIEMLKDHNERKIASQLRAKKFQSMVTEKYPEETIEWSLGGDRAVIKFAEGFSMTIGYSGGYQESEMILYLTEITPGIGLSIDRAYEILKSIK